jgi:hypothetical protein
LFLGYSTPSAVLWPFAAVQSICAPNCHTSAPGCCRGNERVRGSRRLFLRYSHSMPWRCCFPRSRCQCGDPTDCPSHCDLVARRMVQRSSMHDRARGLGTQFTRTPSAAFCCFRFCWCSDTCIKRAWSALQDSVRCLICCVRSRSVRTTSAASLLLLAVLLVLCTIQVKGVQRMLNAGRRQCDRVRGLGRDQRSMRHDTCLRFCWCSDLHRRRLIHSKEEKYPR